MKFLPHAIVAVAVAAAIALAIPAIAAKPSGPYLNVSSAAGAAPTNGSVSSPFTLWGCGYTKTTTIIVWHNYTGPYTEVTPDANGCVSATFSSFGINPPGSYVGQAWQQQGHGWDKSAEVSFSVS